MSSVSRRTRRPKNKAKPTRHYGANSAWQQLSILAHNVARSFQLDTFAEPQAAMREWPMLWQPALFADWGSQQRGPCTPKPPGARKRPGAAVTLLDFAMHHEPDKAPPTPAL
jgi:hypothetical protein